MKVAWIIYLLESLFLVLFNPIISDSEFVGQIFLLLHVIIFGSYLLFLEKKNKEIILVAFFVRVIFLIIDLYFRDKFTLPNSGRDSEQYFLHAISISDNIELLGKTRMGLYSDFLAILYRFIGVNRIFSQYINVLLGINIIYLCSKIFTYLEIKHNISKLSLWILALFPNSVIMSSILLREVFIMFFVTYSIYYFIKWYKYGGDVKMIISSVLLFIASIFHSGVIGLIIGYFFAYLVYDRNKNRLRFNKKTILYFIIISIFSSILFIRFGDIILNKFGNIEDLQSIYDRANLRLNDGESNYLVGLEVTNLFQLIIYTPVRVIYFLFSPMPWNWRGILDIVSFIFDSTTYIFIIYFILNTNKNYKDYPLITCLTIGVLTTCLIFGIGVSNTGTAIRHRQKIFTVLILIYSIISSNKSEISNK